jgi:hypothetical protein
MRVEGRNRLVLGLPYLPLKGKALRSRRFEGTSMACLIFSTLIYLLQWLYLTDLPLRLVEECLPLPPAQEPA